MTSVLIVESPAKCKTINKYLGKGYEVLASFGHIRDLPAKDGSVKPDEDFAMEYEISSDSTRHVKAITDAVKRADTLILATDPDREGEAISWHVLEMLKAKKALPKGMKVQRVTFTSITERAVKEALASPRDLDMDLVNAQQARRALDYLVGFNLSPVLWRKLPGSKSAGRVQSVALRIICEREEEIEKFITQEYWDLHAEFLGTTKKPFAAHLTHYNGTKLDKFALPTGKEAHAVRTALSSMQFSVETVERKQGQRSPYAPFTTSTLQQEASRKLGFGAKRTMQTAQKLYEGIDLGGESTGLITYMRTDGVDVAPEAVQAARGYVTKQFGKEYLPDSPRYYSSKQKNAQEAHEAIRPTDPSRTPDSVKRFLTDDQAKLYDLIWKRMIASQMKNVVLDQVVASIVSQDKKSRFVANGSTIQFEGFYAIYREGIDDDAEDDESTILPPLNEGDVLSFNKLSATEKNPDAHNPFALQHFTQPPPRFTEASLVKQLEKLGIGRPSTYASIISVLQERDYVRLEQKRFFPEMRGRLVTKFLEHYFPRYVEYDFTAKLEEELDDVAVGELDWKTALRNFWGDFSNNVGDAMKLEFSQVVDSLDKLLEPALFPHGASRECPACKKGTLHLKTGKFGAFLGCNNYPECKYTVQLSGQLGGGGEDGENGDTANLANQPKDIGTDPATGLPITMRAGPYGVYLQLGEAKDKKDKPKRASLPKGMKAEDVKLEDAIALLALPRTVGIHPESGKPIVSNNGRFGPYIQHDGKYVSLKGEDSVLNIGINRAVILIAEAAEKKGGRAGAEPLKKLGTHPDSGDEIAIYSGKYGPYAKCGKVNATLPKGTEPNTITLEEAVALINAKGGVKGKKKAPAKTRKAPVKKAASAKKATAKKSSAKK